MKVTAMKLLTTPAVSLVVQEKTDFRTPVQREYYDKIGS